MDIFDNTSWETFFWLNLNLNIWGFPAKEEGIELHADSGGAVEEERQREGSSVQEKGGKLTTLIHISSSRLTEN